ncbi:MAG TPA: nucleoside deaminase [Flavipsychrobacter sp.]|jgi:tRNA(Arg) A34 adenosine deaminase TadA|nr:nucleoside deaminase [Flavipsychrobacter sp.]
MESEFMKLAIEAAKQGMEQGDGGPFGSVVVKDNEVVGVSSNKVFATNDPTAHAEVMAIRAASEKLGTADLSGCEIYSLGEPCPMCMAAIYWAGISKVYFANTKEEAARVGFDDSTLYKQLSLPYHQRSILMSHTPATEAAQLFDDWDCCTDKADLPQT